MGTMKDKLEYFYDLRQSFIDTLNKRGCMLPNTATWERIRICISWLYMNMHPSCLLDDSSEECTLWRKDNLPIDGMTLEMPDLSLLIREPNKE